MPTAQRPRCLPSTRIGLIRKISEWSTDATPNGCTTFWLRGFVGSGKSTVANTVADLFWKQNRLAAFIYFDRNQAALRNPDMFVRTLAYLLGTFNDEIGAKIASAMCEQRHITNRSYAEQFRLLIAEPLAATDSLSTSGPILVVIDALDECDEKSRKGILELFSASLAKLPPSIRFLITSRPEPDIMAVLDGAKHIFPYTIDIKSQSNIEDISLYLRTNLQKLEPKVPEWPGEERISKLVVQADGLFIWASTACKFVQGSAKFVNHDNQLEIVLTHARPVEGQQSIDALYRAVLGDLIDWQDEALVAKYRLVFGTILVLRSPLTIQEIVTFCHAEADNIPEFVRELSALLCGADGSQPLQPWHKSLVDFLTDEDRSGSKFFVDKRVQEGTVAKYCLRAMNDLLVRNILDIQPEYLPRSQVPDLDDRIANIPHHLQYSCSYAIDHVVMMEEQQLEIAGCTYEFLQKHLLHWLEVLSFLGQTFEGVSCLQRLEQWIKVGRYSDILSSTHLANGHREMCDSTLSTFCL